MMSWPRRDDDEPINWGDEPVEPPPPPSTGRSMRLGFGAMYDYLGTSLAISLISFVVVFLTVSFLYTGLLRLANPGQRPAGIVMTGMVLLVAPLFLGPFTAGLFAAAHNMFKHDDPHVFDLGRGAVRLARPALALCYTQTLVTTVLLSDVLYLLARPALPLKVGGILAAYVLLFWLMTATYHWPLLVEQQTPLATTLKRGLYLAVLNPLYTLAFTVVWLLLVLGPAFVFAGFKNGPAILVPVSLLWGALVPALQTAATLEILRKYPGPDEQAG